jgi:hypothetical protein
MAAVASVALSPIGSFTRSGFGAFLAALRARFDGTAPPHMRRPEK